MMSWVNDTLAEFGQRMGLPALAFGSYGVAQLESDTGNLLAVEPVRRGNTDEVLVYLGRPLGFQAPRAIRAALAKAHYTEAGALDVQIATRGQGSQTVLFALTRIAEREFTPQSLERALDYLEQWLDTLPS